MILFKHRFSCILIQFSSPSLLSSQINTERRQANSTFSRWYRRNGKWFLFYERLQFFSEKSKIDKSGSAHFCHEKLLASLMLSHAVGYYTMVRHLFTQWLSCVSFRNNERLAVRMCFRYFHFIYWWAWVCEQ